MGRRIMAQFFFIQFNYFIFSYDASVSQRQQVWRCCPFLQCGDVVRIVFLPTFFNRRNAPTARGVSWCTRITAVGVR